MRKNHIVNLDEESFNLARMLGLTNLSEYVRDCISYFISGTECELTASEIREISKRFALEKRAALLKQQKITGQTEEERQKIEEARQIRQDKIKVSIKNEIDRIGIDRFRKYMVDTDGDYSAIQGDILTAISKDTGVTVELADVLSITGWRV